jgi:hypothetical protein
VIKENENEHREGSREYEEKEEYLKLVNAIPDEV